MNNDSQLDFSECNQNFINTTKIQPFGIILIADLETKKIVNFSNNFFHLKEINPENLLHQSLDFILNKEINEKFEKYLKESSSKKFYSRLELNNKEYEFVGYKLSDKIILEFELIDSKDSNFDLENFLINLNIMPSLEGLLDFSVKELFSFLHYDRIVIYKFKEDWTGEVIEEAKKENIDSLLNLHFPATDIPEQARLMYLSNRVRIIPDIEYTPEAFQYKSLNIEEVKFSPYRDVAPHHKTYMKNMGVKASLVGSIVFSNTLWGLVIFHNLTPKYISIKNRQKIEIIMEKISNQILIISGNNQKINLLQRKNNLKNIFQYFSKFSLKENELNLESIHEDFLKVGTADGYYLKYDNIEVFSKEIPENEVIKALVIEGRKENTRLFTTNSIVSSFQIPIEKLNGFSGICILYFSNPENFIFFFRKENIQVIEWSGNPEEPAIMESKSISPRKSFERWKLLKKNNSISWTESEKESILELIALEETFLRLKIESQLIDSNLKLIQLDNEKNKFFSILSHDLKSPFSGVIGLTELMSNQFEFFSQEEIKENIQEIFKVSKRIDAHLNQLLYYGQLNTGLIKSKVSEFEIMNIFDNIHNEFSNLARERGINFELECNKFVLIYGDETLIYSALKIFIKNAIKYTPKNGTIKIKFFIDTDQLTFVVKDTGIGMDSISQESLFKLDNKKKNLGVNGEIGVGLDLSISKEIANLLNAKIKIVSELQQGTEVYFTLPHFQR